MTETVQKPLNLEDAAAFLSLKPATVYNLVHFGKLPAYKPGGKRLLFKISDLERYAFGNVKGDHQNRADAILNKAQGRKPRKRVKAGGTA